MVRILNEKENERKKKCLAQKGYIKGLLKDMSLGLSNIYKNLDNYNDESIITELSNYEAQLKSIMDNLVYTE